MVPSPLLKGAGPSRLRVFAAWGLSSLPLRCIPSLLSIYHPRKHCTLCSFILFSALSPYCNVSSRVAEAFRSVLSCCVPGTWESRPEVLSERLLMNQGRKNGSVPTACWAPPSASVVPLEPLPPSVPWNCRGALFFLSVFEMLININLNSHSWLESVVLDRGALV